MTAHHQQRPHAHVGQHPPIPPGSRLAAGCATTDGLPTCSRPRLTRQRPDQQRRLPDVKVAPPYGPDTRRARGPTLPLAAHQRRGVHSCHPPPAVAGCCCCHRPHVAATTSAPAPSSRCTSTWQLPAVVRRGHAAATKAGQQTGQPSRKSDATTSVVGRRWQRRTRRGTYATAGPIAAMARMGPTQAAPTLQSALPRSGPYCSLQRPRVGRCCTGCYTGPTTPRPLVDPSRNSVCGSAPLAGVLHIPSYEE